MVKNKLLTFMRINKEGYHIIFTTLLICVVVSLLVFLFCPRIVGWIVAGATLLWWLFVISFFRKPKRAVVRDQHTVYAPADGTVVAVEEIEEMEYLGDRRIQVSVFMSLTNVHMNWYPVSGSVIYFKYHPGQFFVAWHPKSSEKNERTTTVVDTGEHKILFRQIAGFVARRIVSYAREGETVLQNEKCGFIKFGSRVDVMLPPDSEVLVRIGDKVVGSQTPLARLK